MGKKMIFFRDLNEFFFIFFIVSFFILTILFSLLWSQSSADTVYYEGDRIRIQQKEKIITIVGNAFIRKAGQGLKAEKIIWYQDKEYAEAFNKVSFLDREQGVLYKGKYVKFLIERSKVFVRGDASIENRKDKIIIFSDTFEADTKSGSIKAIGNTRMEINKNPEKPVNTVSHNADYSTVNNKIILIKDVTLKTTEQWFSADKIDIDQDNDHMLLENNVRIEDSPEQKKKVAQNNNQNGEQQNSLGDAVLTCNRAKIFTETKYLECFGDVFLERDSGNSYLKSQYLLFDNPKEEILATKNVSSYQRTPTNEQYMYSQYMKIYQKQETTYFTNDVSIIDIELGKTNFQLNCYSMKYLYTKNTKEHVECYDDVEFYNLEEKSWVYADYLYYELKTEVGYVEKEPYYLNRGENRDMYFYSRRINIDQKRNDIVFDKDVFIIEREKKDGATNSTITCNQGRFLYNIINSNDNFTCSGNVVVYMTLNRAHFYGDKLVYYSQKDYSRLDADKRVLFNYKKSSTNIIKGSADYAENFHDLGYSIMSNKVDATEYVNNRAVNHLTAQEVRYHFLGQSNAFEGFRDVVYVNVENDSRLYSEYLFFDLKSNIGWAKENPILLSLDRVENTKSLVYANYIQLNSSNNVSYLKDNIFIYEEEGANQQYSPTPKIPESEDYLNCQEAYYYSQPQQDRIFECVDEMHLVDRENNIDIYSDYMKYNLDTEYGFLKEYPYLVNRRVSNIIKVYSETMEFFQGEGISLFHTNVLTESIDIATGEIHSTIECDDSKYIFGEITNTVECFDNVEIINYPDAYMITSDYLRHQVDDDYSYVSDGAKLVWTGDGKETVVTADLFESFGVENLLYAKGNVKVDNGENEAESSLGVYEPDLNRFTLYGAPLVRDKEGSEFTSEEVYFDVLNNRMILGSDVGGNFIPEDF